MIGLLDFSWLAYPLDVIKTNRIAQSPLFKEAGENLPREATALYERGAFKQGFYRGLAPFAGIYAIQVYGAPSISSQYGFLAAAAAAEPIINTFQVLQTKKQILGAQDLSYKQIIGQLGPRVMTLGLGASICRNLALILAVSPGMNQSRDEASYGLFALGGVLLSHPFEVARVL